jgi:hypothetical protein
VSPEFPLFLVYFAPVADLEDLAPAGSNPTYMIELSIMPFVGRVLRFSTEKDPVPDMLEWAAHQIRLIEAEDFIQVRLFKGARIILDDPGTRN